MCEMRMKWTDRARVHLAFLRGPTIVHNTIKSESEWLRVNDEEFSIANMPVNRKQLSDKLDDSSHFFPIRLISLISLWRASTVFLTSRIHISHYLMYAHRAAARVIIIALESDFERWKFFTSQRALLLHIDRILDVCCCSYVIDVINHKHWIDSHFVSPLHALIKWSKNRARENSFPSEKIYQLDFFMALRSAGKPCDERPSPDSHTR